MKDHFRCNEPQQKRLNLVTSFLPNYIATSQDMYPIRVFSVVRDLTRYNCWCVSSVNTTVVPDFTTLYSWMRWNYVPPHPAYQPAASSVHHTTSCKHSLVLLRIDEIIARNMLSCLELLINRYCCI